MEFEAFINLTPGHARIMSIWMVLYNSIARANFMLETLDDPKVQGVIKTPGYGDWCKGECLFLRSFCNIRLWDLFRKAPNQNIRIGTIEESFLPPTHGFELLDQVIADLTEAIKLLPDSWDAKLKGRAFKNSARGLLVKAYMLRACYGDKIEGGNKNADYANAIRIFETIDPAQSQLVAKFGDNFDYRTENNSESLFELQASFNPGFQDNPWLNANFGGRSGSLGVTWQFFGISMGGVSTEYLCGSYYGPTKKLRDKFEADDPRLKETILNQNTNPSDNKWMQWPTLSDGSKYFGGYQFVKYINGEKMGPLDTDFSINSLNNPRLLRLADVKLLAAEAYLQTGNEPAARQQVNDIRQRARFSNGAEAAAPANLGTVTMENIMDERMRELCGEDDIRWMDMRRWHAAGYIDLATWAKSPLTMWGFDNSKLTAVEFEFDATKHVLFPIPQSEMERNPLMLHDGQNPGYN
jgi:hypothetical protein